MENYLSWDSFVSCQGYSCVYHMAGWRYAIRNAYGHDTYYLVAATIPLTSSSAQACDPYIYCAEDNELPEKAHSVVGIVPFIHIKHWLFGNSLVSIPYFDSGGILTGNEIAEQKLLLEAIKLAFNLGVNRIEIRQNYPILSYRKNELNKHVLLNALNDYKKKSGWHLSEFKNKVRMILNLPETSELLMKSFKAKLRSQIRKPLKEGLTTKIGSIDLIDDFYEIFAINMRDLGSPVHSKKFILEVLKAFPKTANVFIVYGDRKPLACSLTIGFKDTLANPWASSLRRYSHLAPNMLLYWSMLEFACQNGYRRFDFGRSTLGEGTYKFKEQWGARPEPLYWYRLSKIGDQGWGSQPDKNKMSKAIEYWKKLPIPLTKIIGPRIRKYISL